MRHGSRSLRSTLCPAFFRGIGCARLPAFACGIRQGLWDQRGTGAAVVPHRSNPGRRPAQPGAADPVAHPLGCGRPEAAPGQARQTKGT